MDTARSSTPVTEPAEESRSASTQQILLQEPVGSSSAVKRTTTGGERQRGTTLSLRDRAITLLQPVKKVGPAPTAWKSIRAILLASCE